MGDVWSVCECCRIGGMQSGTVTVDTAMFSAGAADACELFFQSLAGAMDADSRISCGDSGFFREGFEG